MDLNEYLESAISMYTSVLEANNKKRDELIKEVMEPEETGEVKDNTEELFYLLIEEKSYQGYLAALLNVKAYVNKPEENAEAVN